MPKDERELGVSQKWRRTFVGEDGRYEKQVRKGDGADYSEQDSAKLRLTLPPDSSLIFDLRVDGKAVDPERVRVGMQASPSSLEASTFSVAELLAEPDRFDPAALPRGFGIYIWYVASAEAIEDDDLPEEMLEMLKALGYAE
jgi:hypothetical protein